MSGTKTLQRSGTKTLQSKGKLNVPAVVYAVICAGALLLFMHPDTMETTNHAYLLLDSIFSGKFFGFYESIAAHQNTLYYINGAHYSILFYLVFAIWELPLYLINVIFSLPPNEPLIWLWGKALSAVFFFLGAGMIGKLASGAGEDGETAKWMMLLNPVAFFFSVMTGQYDSLCIFFVLLTFVYYQKKDMTKFSLLMGVAILFKMFAVFVFIPLVLLQEKKPLRIIKYGVLGMLPYAAETLMFLGRKGDVGGFTGDLLSRLFEQKLGQVPLFPAAYVVLCVLCWLKAAGKDERERLASASVVSMSVFMLLMLFSWYHPQWAYLPMAFWVLTVTTQKNKKLYYYLCAALSLGIILNSWRTYTNHFEINMLFYGVLALFKANGPLVYLPYTPFSEYISHFSVVTSVVQAIVPCVLAAILVTRIPTQNGSLADRYVSEKETVSKGILWLIFAGVLGFWLVAVLANLVRFL